MLQNYLKIGFRNLLKNKLFTLINISGMAISIGSFLVISVFIYDEFQFDRNVEDASLKYRVYSEYFSNNGTARKHSMIPPMVAPTLQTDFPEVEAYSRYMNFNEAVLFEYGDKRYPETKGGWADPSILTMFSLSPAEGDFATALKEPNDVAISETLAKKYFNGKPAIGETLKIFGEDFKVSAVFRDFDDHSHLQLNFFISMAFPITKIPERMESWQWNQFHTYVKLKPGTDAANLQSKMQPFMERHAWPVTKPNGSYSLLHLMPLRDVHLKSSELTWDVAVRGNEQTVYILSVTALFIIVIAILNFINLSTARAVSRVKEVGVRKVVGAARTQLIYQFLSESLIIAFIALLIGGMMTEGILPFLNDFTGKNIPRDIFYNPVVILILLGGTQLIGIAAGAYPAFYISSYRPAQILSNKQSGRGGKNFLRKGMVVLQFVLSFFLIIASLIVSDQHTFLRTKDMGFDKDNILSISIQGDMGNNLEATKNEFSNHPNIISTAYQYGLPGEAFAGDGITDYETKKEWPISMLIVDHDYIKTLGIKLIAGRDFSLDHPSDVKDAWIISESGAKMLGHNNPEEALGHEISWNRWDAPDSVKLGKIIGVVKDFHLSSLHETMSPIILHIFPPGYSSLSVRVKGENIPETLAHLEKTWKKFNPKWPFEYHFIDDNFDRLYKTEEKLATLFEYFTGFTIFVACLGLFGLVVYSNSQKYKEISIRKVLGAEDSSIVFGLSKTYLVLIGIAFVIAIPLSYYASNEWLQKFAYHIEITPWLFIKAALLILGLALLTVGIQSLKAARGNPVDALKEQ